jgi:S-adenosylmethionine decarboxylase proenzyme
MNALGRHILAEYYSCDTTVLNSIELLENCMQSAVRASGATIIDSTFHKFSPHGVSGVIVIAESHMAIHTWPEYGYAAVDFFTCGDRVDPWKAFDYMNKLLKPEKHSTKELQRGLLGPEPQNLLQASL